MEGQELPGTRLSDVVTGRLVEVLEYFRHDRSKTQVEMREPHATKVMEKQRSNWPQEEFEEGGCCHGTYASRAFRLVPGATAPHAIQ